MPATEALSRGALLLWRLLPVLFCLSLGTVFLFQAQDLTGAEALYPAALAAVLVAIAGYNVVREAVPALMNRRPAEEPVTVPAGPAAQDMPRDQERGQAPPAAEPATAAAADSASDASDAAGTAGKAAAERLTTGRPVAVVALLVLSLSLVETVGFFPAAALVAFGALAITGIRRPVPLLVAGSAIWAGAYLVFGLVLDVPLPSGIWG